MDARTMADENGSKPRPRVQRYCARADWEIAYPEHKKCSRCGEVKVVADFSRARREKDGLKSYCKTCGKSERADWYRRNAEREKAKVAAYQKANPEKAREWNRKAWDKGRERYYAATLSRYHANGDENRAVRKQRYAEDPDYRLRLLIGQAIARRRDPEPDRQRSRKFRAENRDLCRYYANQYRARKAGAEGDCSPEEWEAILAYFDNRCAYCLRPENEVGTLAREHMLPLSRGGSNRAENLVPSCKPCNSSKHDKTPMEFLAAQGQLRCTAVPNLSD
jgi:5-methylcytosine-specific restriction endonuclease McrA